MSFRLPSRGSLKMRHCGIEWERRLARAWGASFRRGNAGSTLEHCTPNSSPALWQ